MRRISTWFLLVVLGLAAGTSELGSQQTSPTDPRAVALESVRVGRRVRIHVQGSGVVQGHVLGVSRDSLFLATPVGERGLPLAAFDSLWLRGNAAKTGALVGGLVGGVPWGVAFASSCQSIYEQPCGAGQVLGLFFFGFGVTGLPAAGAGALIGAAVPKWHRKFPRGRSVAPVVTWSPGGVTRVGARFGF